jgi:hypothetical protein
MMEFQLSVDVRPHHRRANLACARLVALASALGLALGCSADSGSGEPLSMVFGPTIEIEAIDIVPDCESADEGEFEGFIGASVSFRPPTELHRIDETLMSNIPVERDVDVTIQLLAGEEVCVASQSVWEIDGQFDPDEGLFNDEDCKTIDAGTTHVDYEIVPTHADDRCALRVTISAEVSPAA